MSFYTTPKIFIVKRMNSFCFKYRNYLYIVGMVVIMVVKYNHFHDMSTENAKYCPYCNSMDIEAKEFDTDIEGGTPVAYLPYICEKCGKRWTLKLVAQFVRYDSERNMK